jgi:hypothetical protein
LPWPASGQKRFCMNARRTGVADLSLTGDGLAGKG